MSKLHRSFWLLLLFLVWLPFTWAADTNLLYNGTTVTIGSGAATTTLTFNSDAGTDGTIAWDGTNDEFEIIGGQIGIGTTSPNDLLHISGASPQMLITDTGATFTSHFASGTASGVYFGNGDPFTANLDDTTKDSWGLAANISATGGSFKIRHATEGVNPRTYNDDITVTSAEGSTFGRTGIGTSAINTDSRLEVNGHVTTEGTAPTVSACGTSPSIIGNDAAGKVTVGTAGPTSCTLTFNLAYTNAPACVVNNEGAIQLIRGVSTTTTLVIDSATAMTSQVISYICIGRG